MADFVAVLKKTIDGMGDTTPEMRARVYERARAAIAAKLAAINPPPADAVVQRQKDLLEKAISSVEGEYAPPPAASADDDFDAILASLERGDEPVAPAAPVAPATPVVRPAPPTPKTPDAATPVASKPVAAAPAAPVREPKPANDAPRTPKTDAEGLNAPETLLAPEKKSYAPPVKRRGRGGLVAVAMIALVFIGAAGYAVWLNSDEVSRMVGLSEPGEEPAAQPSQPAPAVPAPQNTAAAPEAEPVTKFTQKLNSDGSETDTGPGAGSAGPGEGTSLAELTVPPPATPAPPAAQAPAGET
ncbi:MAG: hypothetical protein WBF87_06660, partial [Mesorhizobium sp.]